MFLLVQGEELGIPDVGLSTSVGIVISVSGRVSDAPPANP